ncbi:hypothetical protein BJX99DRAFT_238034 [Aspergillus californicus]
MGLSSPPYLKHTPIGTTVQHLSTMPPPISSTSLLPCLILALASSLPAQASCNPSTLNTTSGVYYAQENQTLFEIAHTVHRGACDIARYNRMADAVIPLTTGEEIIIPPQVCNPDNSTCLITAEPNATYADCVVGGPHTYTTLAGDTMNYIALKLNLTIDALMSTSSMPGLEAGATDEVIGAGQSMKLPQCSPSKCVFRPETFVYGTYKDLAAKVGTTPGQIMALNPTYNHSVEDQGEGPVLTVPRDCVLLSNNVTVIS